MGTDDGKFLSQSFLPWDKKHSCFSGRNLPMTEAESIFFFFTTPNLHTFDSISTVGIPTHTDFPGPLHFTGEQLHQAF